MNKTELKKKKEVLFLTLLLSLLTFFFCGTLAVKKTVWADLILA